MIKVKLNDFLENPTGAITDINTKKKSLEELQPFIIHVNNPKGINKLIEEFDKREIEYYINPNEIETPVNGFHIYEEMEFY